MQGEQRLLTLADVEPAAQVIAEAFVDDPLCVFMLPRRRTRITTLYKFFRAYGEINIRHGRGYGVGTPLQAVAYWKFPEQAEVSISVKGLRNFVPLLLTRYPIGYMRAQPILKRQEALRQAYAAEPHFYLDNIGVQLSARGQGLSSRLIRPVLQRADEQRRIVYTDTFTESNVALYEHFGFHCVERATVPSLGLTVWALRRAAAA